MFAAKQSDPWPCAGAAIPSRSKPVDRRGQLQRSDGYCLDENREAGAG